MAIPGDINRRDFLRCAARRPRVIDLSCERLYMRYVDARSAGSLPALLESLQHEFSTVDEIRITHREWLSRDDFREDIGPLLRAFGA
jgi:hypothetical protein